MFGLDNYTIPNDQFSDPFITCCFISDSQIFVNFYHNHSTTHYHFIWDLKYKCVIGSPVFNDKGQRLADAPITRKIESNLKNFPNECFYHKLKNRVYSFYRQGQAFCIDPENLENYRFERITELDLGQIELVYGEVLVFSSLNRILFFK